MKLEFFITDVFGSAPYTGNQLATFLGAGDLPTELMQKIAREINFSETTFVETPAPGVFKVRIFSPAEELPFAGHPSLGTAHVIREHLIQAPVASLSLELAVGPVPINFAPDGVVWMDQPEPVFGQRLEATALAAVLGLTSDQIETRHPCQIVSTGLPHIIVPLKDLAALKACNVGRAAYAELVQATGVSCLLAFSPEPYHAGHELSVRMFAEACGIVEDAATGSGNGCLAAWLLEQRYFGSDSLAIHTAQGYELGRPSRLSLKAARQGGQISVAVGGRVFELAQGWWATCHQDGPA